MEIKEYIANVNRRFRSGISREHTYRGDLQTLLEGMLPKVMVTNEGERIDCGAPDFILTRNGVPVGYIEAKDIGEPLTGKKHKEQFDRYRESLPNIIFTDYLDFHYYREGVFVDSVRIGEMAGDTIRFVAANEGKFRELIQHFSEQHLQTIRSSSKLSKMMAAKARLLADVIEKAIIYDDEYRSSRVDSALRDQLSAFQNVLIHDINEKEFADIYAQTIAYGMFAARLHDKDLETFSRFEAARLIPKSNPFLRKLFQYIAGYDLDDRIAWIVDALADIFRATDVAALLRDFGKSTQQTDPIIHFYETFLAEFDPKLRKSRGVWYTPEPVVNFIVRAVDDILKTEFGLKDGLADTSKTTVMVKTDIPDKKSPTKYKMREEEVHKVQILDPAAGTGTFLAEVIKQIHKKFEGQQGIWPDYVENHLIPRLNGFEILMASYAMAHLKLDMLLKETGYDRESNQRFRVYLTNSLEEHHPDTGTLFAGWLSAEANEANHIKRDTPVMVVLGNPPYSVSSRNKSAWIEGLMKDYKRSLNERNIQPLSDDYIKFFRFAHHFIEKNGDGIIAYISNNSYIDGLIHRQMRKTLKSSFDKIFIINLHGSSKKNERSPLGEKDENVFDIMQGVSIGIFVKTKSLNKKIIYHKDIFGNRKSKYNYLFKKSISNINWIEIKSDEPNYYFIPKNFDNKEKYELGFSTLHLFDLGASGLVTARDKLVIHFDKFSLEKTISDFKDLDENSFRYKYEEKKDSRDWKYSSALEDLKNEKGEIITIQHRPFDYRKSYYTGVTKGFMSYPRDEIMSNFIGKENVGLIVPRQLQGDFHHSFITKNVCDGNITSSARLFGAGYVCPLYIYQDNNQQTLDGTPERRPNLNSKIVKKIAEGLGLKFTPEKPTPSPSKEGSFPSEVFAPIDLLDYIYAVLHSPTYRETYKEFLKIDFPRVPYPEDPERFWKLVSLGGELRKLHLMEHPVLEEYITTYPKAGSNEVTRKLTASSPGYEPDGPDSETGKVWINDGQYFGNVPKTAWEFYIGGYQPAQKWLKDRRGRVLTMEEIQHYQRIVVALVETGRIMGEVDGVVGMEK